MPTNKPNERAATSHSIATPPTDFDKKMVTIEGCASDPLERSFLHAFVACLTPAETCRGLIESLAKSTALGLALRNRLLRLASEGDALIEIDTLGRALLDTTPNDSRSSARRNAHLSQLFSYFTPPTRKAVLEYWLDLGTKGAMQRWLKAITDDPMFFDINEVIAFWRRSKEPNAAALFAKHASPEALSSLLVDLIEASSPGWVVSKSALRASAIPDDAWAAMRQDMPATYAYLCGKLKRKISNSEAIEIIEACDPFDGRGLAIWAIGQLGMWDVLEEVRRRGAVGNGDFDVVSETNV
jgi:hypothetical protein